MQIRVNLRSTLGGDAVRLALQLVVLVKNDPFVEHISTPNAVKDAGLRSSA